MSESVSFTVKELLQMLQDTIAKELSEVAKRLDGIEKKLDHKADAQIVVALESRVSALEAGTLKMGGPVDKQVEKHDARIGKVELQLAATAALSTFQRWLIGTVGVGVFGALATLVWLASGH